MEAPSQDAHEVWAEYRKIQDYLNSLPELAKLREEAKARVAPTPRDELYRENSLTVYRYRRDTPATQPRPLLVVPSLVELSKHHPRRGARWFVEEEGQVIWVPQMMMLISHGRWPVTQPTEIENVEPSHD